MKKIIISLLLVLVSCNFAKDVKLKQEVRVFKILDNTCSVSTYVWTYKNTFVHTLEYSEFEECACDDIEATKEVELHKALTVYNMVRKKYLGHGK